MRGQAAVEYLMTYGWAILALVIIIGIILSSGAPSYLVSEECNLGSNLLCPSGTFAVFNKGDSAYLTMEIHNGFPYKIRVNEVSVFSRTEQKAYQFTLPPDTTIDSGDSLPIEEEKLGDPLPANSIARFFINLTYAICAPEVAETGECSDSNHTITGTLTARVISD